ncbi:Holliday junction branch migration protein RuvA [Brevibacillus massiliensis]|jgi:Holliday junction DNA helicase RuvA|uniref:Holliday junction branch migration protein RuvA n=1 Tax=Brevibacillus massiliensis TaxID=1118054 RepID=UPI000306D152|nr:Holliday junction branch migration protein RuvA [Brevibacillus massiliensis]
MIDFIEGAIAYIDSEYIVVETAGIGYRLFCPNPYAFVSREGHQQRFFTHHHVREDAISLYGFGSRDERDLFRRLLDVTGIGPKGALAILSAATPEQIVMAVEQENVAYLTKFPGIGKKTAQRMILDLKDKLKGFTPSFITSAAAAMTASPEAGAGSLQEALEALTALGYTDAELVKVKGALAEQAQQGGTVEQLIKQALALLARG